MTATSKGRGKYALNIRSREDRIYFIYLMANWKCPASNNVESIGFLDLQQQLSLKLRSPVLSGAGAWGPSWPRSGPALLRGGDDQSAGCGTDYSLSRRPAWPSARTTKRREWPHQWDVDLETARTQAGAFPQPSSLELSSVMRILVVAALCGCVAVEAKAVGNGKDGLQVEKL